MTDSKYKKLINNSLIFTVGNFGSKLLVFLMVPFYTYYLTTNQYGTVDLITTTVSLTMPLVLLNVYDAVLRFIMDKEYSKEQVLSNSIAIFSISIVSTSLIYLGILFFHVKNSELIFLFFLIVLAQGLQSLISQYARGSGKVKLYAVNGMLLAFFLAIFNIIFLVYFKLEIEGYLFSIILSNIVSIVHLVLAMKIKDSISLKHINKDIIIEMLKYSLPLIPNSVMWWLMNTASKYFVLFFIGTTANGLLAVASKIPGIVSLVNSIFFQAWQLSAIEEYESNNKSEFYSLVFDYFSFIMFLTVGLLVMVLQPIMNIMSSSYYIAWKIVPFLLISVIYSSFSSFLGTNYIAAKETNGIFYTTIVGAVVNVVINLLTIPFLGVNSVGIGNAISFIVMFYMRYKDTKKFVNIIIDWKKFSINQLIILVEIIVIFVIQNFALQFLINLILVLLILFSNRTMLKDLSRLVLKRRK